MPDDDIMEFGMFDEEPSYNPMQFNVSMERTPIVGRHIHVVNKIMRYLPVALSYLPPSKI